MKGALFVEVIFAVDSHFLPNKFFHFPVGVFNCNKMAETSENLNAENLTKYESCIPNKCFIYEIIRDNDVLQCRKCQRFVVKRNMKKAFNVSFLDWIVWRGRLTSL